MKIAIGLSGGVDSSVAAALLLEAGHEVTGVTMKIWRDGLYRGGDRDGCFGPGEADDIRRAEALCRQLGIAYRVFDCADAYESVVLDYFRREYLAGRTPNPCIRCNAFMKFGVLIELARQSGLEFDRFATGHYARIRPAADGPALYAGCDAARDQSYFLHRLPRARLEHLLFPLGEYAKPEVRRLAARFGLAVKDQPDSQDFYSGDYTELLHAPDRPGDIVDAEGRVLGRHNGFWHYTVGQRKGLGLASPRPLYVIELNSCRNEVVVGAASDTLRRYLRAGDPNWLVPLPVAGTMVSAKVRSAGKSLPARVLETSESGFRLEFPDGVNAPARGQSAVLYDGGRVLGGGVIEEAWLNG